MRAARDIALQPTPFVSSLSLVHGPLDRLTHFFLLAEERFASIGLTLTVGSFEELLATNKAHSASWRPLLPSFDHTQSHLTDENSLCVFGRDLAGDVVATVAGRLHVWTDTNLFLEAENMRLFYEDPASSRVAGEQWHISAEQTRVIVGRVNFTGAAWYRPDQRGKGIALVMPRIGRFYEMSRWHTDFTATIMADGLTKSSFLKRIGHRHLDWALDMENTPVLRGGNIRAAVLWTDAAELLGDLDSKLDELV